MRITLAYLCCGLQHRRKITNVKKATREYLNARRISWCLLNYTDWKTCEQRGALTSVRGLAPRLMPTLRPSCVLLERLGATVSCILRWTNNAKFMHHNYISTSHNQNHGIQSQTCAVSSRDICSASSSSSSDSLRRATFGGLDWGYNTYTSMKELWNHERKL